MSKSKKLKFALAGLAGENKLRPPRRGEEESDGYAVHRCTNFYGRHLIPPEWAMERGKTHVCPECGSPMREIPDEEFGRR